MEKLQGSDQEKQVRVLCHQLEIPYDKLTGEEFVALIKALRLSPKLRGYTSQRGKGNLQHGKGKRKKK